MRLDADTLVIRIPEDKSAERKEQKVRVPLGKVSQVVVFGNPTITTPAITALIEQRIEICYLSRHGKFIARVAGDDHKHGQLRLLQRRAHDDRNTVLQIARVCIRSKLHNQRTLLLRSNRVRDDALIDHAAESIGQLMVQLDQLPLDESDQFDSADPQKDSVFGQMMGLEGAAAAAYFKAFPLLFEDQWARLFTGRHKRPPTDPVNALLSLGYVLLTTQCSGAAHIVGFDPYVGFLHSTQYGKPALALDIIEMFRAPIVDSVVLTLLNNRMLDLADFEEGLGAWRLTTGGRKVFLQKFEERMNAEIMHPIFKYKTSYRRCLELQMRLLSRCLLGEFERYRGFYTR
jgi:CRISPR-associated protein Cas1